jgi:outer membrane protein assembly factor BamB
MSSLKSLLLFLPTALAIGCTGAQRVGATVEPPRRAAVASQGGSDSPGRRLSDAERLTLLHKTLASASDPHDAVISVAAIGNASSVPFLIEVLARQGVVPPSGPFLSGDTRAHCLEALQIITNQDAGRNAEDWRAWYDEHKGQPQEDWVRDGFARRQFPVATPPDDAFVKALIRASDPKSQPRYLQINALRTLRPMRSDTVVRLAKELSESGETADKRAAIAALERVDDAARLNVLRHLAKDGDVDVAENALRTLNVAVRSSQPAIAAETVWEVRLAKAGVHVLNVLDEETVVLGIGYGVIDKTQVAGFDLVTHKIRWTYPTADGVRSNAARLGDHLYFVSDDRVLHCISVTGKPVWAKPLTPRPDLGTTGPAIVEAFGRLFVPDDKSLYVVTPEGAVQTYAMGEHVSRSLVRGRRRVFAAIHNGPLLVFDDPTQPPTRVDTGLNAAALSAAGNAVCVVGFGPVYQVKCLDQDSLRELWRAELPNESGAYKEIQQDADNVYVLAQGRALAFDVSSGKRLWATNEFRSFPPFKLLRGLVLTQNSGTPLEWRDRVSGEVLASWERGNRTYASNAELVGDKLLIEIRDLDDKGDGLRLVNLPAEITKRFEAR